MSDILEFDDMTPEEQDAYIAGMAENARRRMFGLALDPEEVALACLEPDPKPVPAEEGLEPPTYEEQLMMRDQCDDPLLHAKMADFEAALVWVASQEYEVEDVEVDEGGCHGIVREFGEGEVTRRCLRICEVAARCGWHLLKPPLCFPAGLTDGLTERERTVIWYQRAAEHWLASVPASRLSKHTESWAAAGTIVAAEVERWLQTSEGTMPFRNQKAAVAWMRRAEALSKQIQSPIPWGPNTVALLL